MLHARILALLGLSCLVGRLAPGLFGRTRRGIAGRVGRRVVRRIGAAVALRDIRGEAARRRFLLAILRDAEAAQQFGGLPIDAALGGAGILPGLGVAARLGLVEQ